MITTTEESNARKEKGETLQMNVAAKLRAALSWPPKTVPLFVD